MLLPAIYPQIEARDALTFSEWGPPLALEQYRVRERRLRAHPYARDHMESWNWTTAQDPQAILSTCETFRMRSVLITREGSVEGVSYGIASVLTATELRGHRHASHMLEQLVAHLRSRDSHRIQGIHLYSDVGTPIYERLGFDPTDARDLVLPAAGPTDSGSTPPKVFGADLLTREEVCRALDRIGPDPSLRVGDFVLQPTGAQMDWHFERERCYAELLGRQIPEFGGAHLYDSRSNSMIVWFADHKSGELRVCLAWGPKARKLLGHAQWAAARCGLPRVRLWSSEFGDRDATEGTVLRDGAIPMLLSCSEGVTAARWARVSRSGWV